MGVGWSVIADQIRMKRSYTVNSSRSLLLTRNGVCVCARKFFFHGSLLGKDLKHCLQSKNVV